MNLTRLKQVDTLKLLLGINILLFLVALLFELITGEFERFDLQFFSMTGVFDSRLIQDGQLWLLITANFIHYDPIHFVMNMYALYTLGRVVKKFYSDELVLIVYVLGGITASLFTYGYSIYTGNPISSLGASGSIFAFLGLLVAGAVRYKRTGRGIPLDVKLFYPTLILSAAISLLPQINLWAHLGGFLLGFIIGNYLNPDLFSIVPKREKDITKALFYLSYGILFITAIAFIINFLNILLFSDI